MEVAEREARVRRFVDEVWNGRNYEAAAELCGENYVNMMFGLRDLLGLAPGAGRLVDNERLVFV
jgi:hypothetical protein